MRVVDDARVEKGKTRWLLCMDSKRRFLSYLHRYGEPPKIYRGDAIELQDYDEKGNEIRPK